VLKVHFLLCHYLLYWYTWSS